MFSKERIRVRKEEAWTSDINKAYDKFQGKQYKSQKRKLLEFALLKVHGWINQWQLIILIWLLRRYHRITYYYINPFDR